MSLPFSFFQGGVSPFRTLLNTVRPFLPPPITSPSTGFSPEARTPPGTGATPVFTEDWRSGTPSGNFTFTSASTRTYIDSTGTRQTAAINTPRMQCRWNGTTWQQIGVLTEPGYTNLVLNSDDLTNASFSKNQVTATTSGTLGANNSTAMVQIAGNGVSTTHNVFRGTGSSGITSNQSFYCGWDIKKGTWNFVFCCANASGITGGWVGCILNLNTGAISEVVHGTAGAFDVQPVATVLRNGIYRVEFVAHITGTITTINTPVGFAGAASGNSYASSSGDTVCTVATGDTILIGGCMHAISTELCQHIVTAGSTVSTSADILKLTTGFGTLSTAGYGVVIEAEASYGQTDDEYLEGRGGGGGADVCDLYLTSPTQWENYTTGTLDATTNPQLPGGTPFRWASSFDTGRDAASINEQVVKSGVPPTLFAPDTFYLGSIEGTSSFTPTIFRSIAIYNQALTDSQLVYLSSVGGPYTIVSAAVGIDAGSATFNLTGFSTTIDVGLPASSGNYALTGNNASINVGLPAGSGSFALVGFSATDAVGEPLGAGSYALTGRNAGINVGLPAASGAYALTGNSASLIAIRKLPAASGAFALTGYSTVINVGLPASSGSYALTGNTATINVSLGLSSGAFSLVGFSAGEAVNLGFGSGSYALTGNPAGLNVGLPLGKGTYNLTGNSASLIAIRKLPAASGSFALTGYSTTINVGLPAGFGSYAITGRNLGVGVGLPLSSGAFNLTGFSSTLADAMPAGAGSYALTGNPLGIDVGMPLGRGAYTLTGNPASLVSSASSPNLDASSGAFALTGYATTINVGLPAASGNYAVTGRNAGINVGLPAGSGAYSLNGNPATLAAHVRVAVAGGTFSLTGGTLSFQANEPLGSGAYSLTGHDAGLAIGLPLGSGAYALTGNDADLHTAVFASLSLGGTPISFAFNMDASAQLFRRKYPLHMQPKPSGTFVSIPYEAELRKADPDFYRDRRNAPEYDIGRRLFTGDPAERGAYAGDPAPTNIFSETTPDLSGVDQLSD